MRHLVYEGLCNTLNHIRIHDRFIDGGRDAVSTTDNLHYFNISLPHYVTTYYLAIVFGIIVIAKHLQFKHVYANTVFVTSQLITSPLQGSTFYKV